MLLENYPYPGDGRVRGEALALAACGYGVTVISPRAADEASRETVQGIKVYRFPPPKPGSGLIGYLWEYGYSIVVMFAVSVLVLAREGFDVVHVAQPPDGLAFIAAFYKLLGKRYVLDHHDLSPELYYYARFGHRGNPIVYRVLLVLERMAFAIADRVISTNESYRDIAIHRGHMDERRVTVVRNGAENNGAARTASEQILPKAGRTIIGYLGVIGTQDGVDNLLRAVHQLVYGLNRRDFLCVIVGYGSAMPALQILARDLKIESYVLFTGWVRGRQLITQYLSEMDICVAPEPSDPYNDRSTAVKVMEYMAAGKPIVSFDLPEHHITAREAATYAKPGDTLDLAMRICRLMDDPTEREKMGAAGQRRIESELAWSHQSAKLVAMYASLTGK